MDDSTAKAGGIEFDSVNFTDEEPAALRAALNEELGFYPASLDEASIARYRRQAAAETAFYDNYLRAYGPNGYRRNQYCHLAEQKRQESAEEAVRASVADLYE